MEINTHMKSIAKMLLATSLLVGCADNDAVPTSDTPAALEAPHMTSCSVYGSDAPPVERDVATLPADCQIVAIQSVYGYGAGSQHDGELVCIDVGAESGDGVHLCPKACQ